MAAAVTLHLELEVEETGRFAVETDLPIARGRENLCVRAFERLHPADGFTFRIRSEIPLSGGLGSSAAAIVAGLMAADHLFELDADLLGTGERARGPPRQRRRGAARRVRRSAPTAPRPASSRRPGWRRWRSCPTSAVRTRAARAALPAEVPMEEAVFNVAHAALLTLGLRARRLGPARARACRTACTRSGARTCSRARMELAAPRARARRARGDDLRRRARPCWCGASTSRPARSPRRSAARSRAGRSLLRAPFEPQGAYVEEL